MKEKTIIVIMPRDEDRDFINEEIYHRIKFIFCRGWYYEFVLEAK